MRIQSHVPAAQEVRSLPFLWSQALVFLFGFGPASACRLPCNICSLHKGWGLLGLTCSVGLGRAWGMAPTIRLCGECLQWGDLLETCYKLLQSAVGCALSQRNWPYVMGLLEELSCIGSQEVLGSDLRLFTTWPQLLQPSYLLLGFHTPALSRPAPLALVPASLVTGLRACPPLGSQTAAG